MEHDTSMKPLGLRAKLWRNSYYGWWGICTYCYTVPADAVFSQPFTDNPLSTVLLAWPPPPPGLHAFLSFIHDWAIDGSNAHIMVRALLQYSGRGKYCPCDMWVLWQKLSRSMKMLVWQLATMCLKPPIFAWLSWHWHLPRLLVAAILCSFWPIPAHRSGLLIR